MAWTDPSTVSVSQLATAALWNQQVRDNLKWLAADGRGTTFPASPVDGQRFIYTADAANGVQWEFIYNAGSASTYKWEFIGGGAAYVSGTTAVPGTSVWTTLLSFTAARAGTYEVSGGWYGVGAAGGAGNYFTGVGIAGAIQGTTAQTQAPASNNFTVTGVPFTVTVTAGQAINLMGQANQVPTGPFETMTVRPIRVI